VKGNEGAKAVPEDPGDGGELGAADGEIVSRVLDTALVVIDAVSDSDGVGPLRSGVGDEAMVGGVTMRIGGATVAMVGAAGRKGGVENGKNGDLVSEHGRAGSSAVEVGRKLPSRLKKRLQNKKEDDHSGLYRAYGRRRSRRRRGEKGGKTAKSMKTD
jgi:hypothetical protein